MVGYEDCDPDELGCENVGMGVGAIERCGSCENDCTAKGWQHVSDYKCNICMGMDYADCRDLCVEQETLNFNESGDEIHECYYCSIMTCETGYADCNDDSQDGCETNIFAGDSADPQNCGQCGNHCDLPHTSTYLCVEGVCEPLDCDEGYGHCDEWTNNGCEVDLNTNPDHCGDCNHRCNDLGWADVQGYNCIGGECEIASCNTNFRDCDGQLNTGCETNISTSEDGTHCGACNDHCSERVWNCGENCHVESYRCEYTECLIDTCEDGYRDCDGLAGNGCEVDLSDPYTCGGCVGEAGRRNCSALNWSHVQSYGCYFDTGNESYECRIEACNNGWGDCDENKITGCEVNINTNTSHCGRCDHACTLDGSAVFECINGVCAFEECLPPWDECEPDDDDLCESNLRENVHHCGGCSNDCTEQSCGDQCHVATFACAGIMQDPTSETAKCYIPENGCEEGYGNCDRIGSFDDMQNLISGIANGCERNLVQNDDGLHCGECGNDCSDLNWDQVSEYRCETSSCKIKTCAGTYDNCNEVESDGCEIDIATNTSHCGECDHVCDLPQTYEKCAGGICKVDTCHYGYEDCNSTDSDGCETNLLDDVTRCGDCRINCTTKDWWKVATYRCDNGTCAIDTCKAGWKDCNGVPTDGCEKHISEDVNNCGDCGEVCSFSHATPICQDYVCHISNCDGGWGDCNDLESDGCETYVSANIYHCGTCNHACSYNHASSYCTSGNCYMDTCDSGWGNCENGTADGCETNLRDSDDGTHCGSCNYDCSSLEWDNVAGYVCAEGTCTIGECDPGTKDCDGNPNNGCEINVLSDENHCGDCNVSCSYSNAVTFCDGGTCMMDHCVDSYADCNDDLISDGCEADLSSDTSHCGACNDLCSLETKPYATGVECSADNCEDPGCCHATGCESPLELQEGSCVCVGTATCSCDDSELDNRWQDAVELTPGQPFVSRSLCPIGDKDWFGFVLDGTYFVKIDLKLNTGLDLEMKLYNDPEGEAVASYTYTGSDGVTLEWMVESSLPAGSYYLFAKNANLPPTSVEEYKVRIQLF